MRPLLSLLLLFFLLSCTQKKSEGKVTQHSPQPAHFSFPLSKTHPPYLVIENVGDVEVKGSMPGTAVLLITKRGRAHSKKRAAHLMDAITFNPTMKKGKIHFAPTYPKTNSGESATTSLQALVPLNMEVPLNIAVTNGDVGIRGTKGVVNLLVKGKSAVDFSVFKGRVYATLDQGTLTLSNHIEGANITMNRGRITLSQREREPLHDITIALQEGTVVLELLKGLKMRYEIIAPTIQNRSSLKLTQGRGGSGKTLKVVVKKGSVVLQPELF